MAMKVQLGKSIVCMDMVSIDQRYPPLEYAGEKLRKDDISHVSSDWRMSMT